MTRPPRHLVVAADDFGLCPAVNEATVLAATSGMVTSVELMVPTPGFTHAVELIRANPSLDVGIHITLTSEQTGGRWGGVLPAEEVQSLYAYGEAFLPLDVDGLRRCDFNDIHAEVTAQVELLLAAGIKPTHYTQHMVALDEMGSAEPRIVDLIEALFRNYQLAGRVTQAALREELARRGVPSFGNSFLEGHDVEPSHKLDAYVQWLQGQSAGFAELIVHCGFDGAELRQAVGSAARRQKDLDLMLDGTLRDCTRREGYVLRSWGELLEGERSQPRDAAHKSDLPIR